MRRKTVSGRDDDIADTDIGLFRNAQFFKNRGREKFNQASLAAEEREMPSRSF
ncbi:hypothetical protein [Methanolacinia petrolearia]|uniref:hypothetical protein n=1 Tax=Methanolacinia petrolearia TaxID=54120 RepID=UPI003BAD2ACF